MGVNREELVIRDKNDFAGLNPCLEVTAKKNGVYIDYIKYNLPDDVIQRCNYFTGNQLLDIAKYYACKKAKEDEYAIGICDAAKLTPLWSKVPVYIGRLYAMTHEGLTWYDNHLLDEDDKESSALGSIGLKPKIVH